MCWLMYQTPRNEAWCWVMMLDTTRSGFQMHVPKPVDAEHLLRVVGQLAKQGANVR